MALASEESRVLLLYTGGTIGMLVSDAGYVPEPFFLFETLRSQTSRFHDPLGDSLLSRGRSVEGFRAWSEGRSREQSKSRSRAVSRERRDTLEKGSSRGTSALNVLHEHGLPEGREGDGNEDGEKTPAHERQDPFATSQDSSPRQLPLGLHSPSTLLVRSTRPLQAPPLMEDLQDPLYSLLARPQGADGTLPRCKKVRENCYEMHLPSLVTPAASSAPGGNVKRIRYAVLEWNPLLDSSNMEIDDWIRIAEEIELNYHLFDAFVVLHGTDTMCYSSSALSFLLEDLGKTVILTGAQIPLSQLRNDAVENLMGALSIAGQYLIPECSLFFNHRLFRGNRVSKMSSTDYDAFNSPNFSPLAHIGIDIDINWADVVRPTSLRAFKAHKDMCPNVATLRLFPGITAATVRAFLSPPVQGVVLETFGAGNAPQRADLMQAIKEACDRGVVIVAISQCAKGTVSDAYETGRTLQAVGVASGGDMTTECALAKLAYLLSKTDRLSSGEVHALMQVPLRGELTLPSTLSVRAPPTQAVASESGTLTTDTFGSLLNHITRLSTLHNSVPSIQVAAPGDKTRQQQPQRQKLAPSMTLLGPTVALSTSARDTASSWGSTANEAASAEVALYPYLVHLAMAKDDVETLRFCLGVSPPMTTDEESPSEIEGLPVSQSNSNRDLVKGGMANCLDIASGRTPLHVASLNGSVKCVKVLLEAGALVHIRDSLDHTALYYAARNGQGAIVDSLIQAGAHFGGVDVEGGYVRLAVKLAQSVGDLAALAIWAKAGAKLVKEQFNLRSPAHLATDHLDSPPGHAAKQMAKMEQNPVTSTPTGASKFLAGASSLVLLQVLTRVVTFFLNQILVRLSTPQVFGTAAIQFELLLSTILFLSREGVRLALLRASDSAEKGDKKPKDEPKAVMESPITASTPSKTTRKRKANQTSTEEPQDSRKEKETREISVLASNIATLPVMLGIPLSVALPLVYTYTASSETSSQPYFHASIIIYTLSALVQLAAEPMYIFAQQELDFNVRLRSEASGVISRAAVTVAVLFLAKRLGRMGEKAMGEGDEWGLLAFAIGQLAYGVFVFATYLWTYWSRSAEWRWWPISVAIVEKGHSKARFFDPTLLTLTISMTLQSLVKHLLTEGDKLAVSRTSKLADQGGYAVASNYGSLVARIIFQPVEEISRVYFSKTLSVCTSEQDEASAKELRQSHARRPITGNKSDKAQPGKPLTTVQQAALRQASTALNTLLLLQSHLLLILLTFLPPYLPTLLSHFLPKKYLNTSAPSILQAYAYYLPMMSLNGLLEAFAFSVMSPSDVKTQTRWLFVTSICFGVSVWILSDRLGLGEVGLVYANVASLGMRVAWAALFSDRWFKRMWARGVGEEADVSEKNKDVVGSATTVPGISFRDILPPLSVLILFAVSSQIVRYSQAWFVLGDNNPPQQSRDVGVLIAQAKHVAIGGFFVLLCLGECYRSQRAHVQTLVSLVRSRSV